MGQAFDSDGNVLGEAEGATKREVFEKLQKAHPTAEEIRIKTQRAEADFRAAASGTRPSDGRFDVGSAEYIAEVFTYHAPDDEQRKRYEVLRESARSFARDLVACCPASADRTDALRKLRECVMTANASIALKGRA